MDPVIAGSRNSSDGWTFHIDRCIYFSTYGRIFHSSEEEEKPPSPITVQRSPSKTKIPVFTPHYGKPHTFKTFRDLTCSGNRMSQCLFHDR